MIASPTNGNTYGRSLHRPFGTEPEGPWQVSITPKSAGWSFTGIRVADLAPGDTIDFETGEFEALVVPIHGSCVIEVEGRQLELAGRSDVFSGPTDFAYLPRDCAAVLRSAGGGRFAVPVAIARRKLPVRHIPAGEVSSAPRGAGACSRLVRDYCMPGQVEADRLLVCEVVTPSGNWSSYPPHKHDRESADESALEEIYYFEVAGGPAGPGHGYQRVYSSPGRPVNVLAEVGSGDVVLVPYGWHGPSVAMPGYDLYYLNAMAGAGERAWRICDDPAHAWIRETWIYQPLDPRIAEALRSEGRA